MPDGVVVVVEYGEATIDFMDPKLRGHGVAALLAAADNPGQVETLTRSGPRRLYRVPETVARAAGLLDEPAESFDWPDTSSASQTQGFVPASEPTVANLFAQDVRAGSYSNTGSSGVVAEPAAGEAGVGGYDDGQPDMDWSRKAIDDFAARLDPPIDTTGEKNKQAAIDAIRAAQQPG